MDDGPPHNRPNAPSMKISALASAVHHWIRPHVITRSRMEKFALADVIAAKSGRDAISQKTVGKLMEMFNMRSGIPNKCGSNVRYTPLDFGASNQDVDCPERRMPLNFVRCELNQAFSTLKTTELGYDAKATFLSNLHAFEKQLNNAESCWKEHLAANADGSDPTQAKAAQLARDWLGPQVAIPERRDASAQIAQGASPVREGTTGVATLIGDVDAHAAEVFIDWRTMSLEKCFSMKARLEKVSDTTLRKLDKAFARIYGIHGTASVMTNLDFDRFRSKGVRSLAQATADLAKIRHMIESMPEPRIPSKSVDGTHLASPAKKSLLYKVETYETAVKAAKHYHLETIQHYARTYPDVTANDLLDDNAKENRDIYQALSAAQSWLGLSRADLVKRINSMRQSTTPSSSPIEHPARVASSTPSVTTKGRAPDVPVDPAKHIASPATPITITKGLTPVLPGAFYGGNGGQFDFEPFNPHGKAPAVPGIPAKRVALDATPDSIKHVPPPVPANKFSSHKINDGKYDFEPFNPNAREPNHSEA